MSTASIFMEALQDIHFKSHTVSCGQYVFCSKKKNVERGGWWVAVGKEHG